MDVYKNIESCQNNGLSWTSMVQSEVSYISSTRRIQKDVHQRSGHKEAIDRSHHPWYYTHVSFRYKGTCHGNTYLLDTSYWLLHQLIRKGWHNYLLSQPTMIDANL